MFAKTWLPMMLLLTACGASPAPRFFGATRHEVTAGGIDFVVFQKETSVEVVRLGYLTLAQRGAVPKLMSVAAEQATGCKVRPDSMVTGIPGDTGEAKFDLDC